MHRMIRNILSRPAKHTFNRLANLKNLRRSRLQINSLEDRCVPATFTVNVDTDNPLGTGGVGLTGDLRYCITEANKDALIDTIQFDSVFFGTTKTIKLTASTPLNITTGMIIDGDLTGSKAPIVDGQAATQLLTIATGDDTTPVTINDMTWTRGKLTGLGVKGAGFQVNQASLTISNVTISKCVNQDSGGAIHMESGSLTATGSTITGNTIDALANGPEGVGVYFFGANTSGTFTKCTISNNVGSSSMSGKNVFGAALGVNTAGNVTLTDCIITGNSTNGPAAVAYHYYYATGVLSFINCTIANNSSSSSAGAIAAVTKVGGILNITGCTVFGNTSANAGGVISMYTGTETVNISGSRFEGNFAPTGGVIATFNAPSAGTINIDTSSFINNKATGGQGGVALFQGGGNHIIDIQNSTFNGNTATSSGGVFSRNAGTGGSISVRNSTMVNNSSGAAGSGGAIRLTGAFAGTLLVESSTIANNNAPLNGAGGISVANSAGTSTITVVNSIIAGNTYGGAPNPDISGDISRANPAPTWNIDFSQIGVTPTNAIFTETSPGSNKLNVPANLFPLLTNYGGKTFTLPPLVTNAGVDMGTASTITLDQRGAGYPRPFGASVDMGAVEQNVPGPWVSKVTAANVTTAGGTTYEFDVTFEDLGLVDNTTLGAPGAISIQRFATFAPPIIATLKTPIGAPGASLTATYQFTPPGGTWDGGDNGRYVISVVGGKIFDTVGGPTHDVAGDVYGSFTVGVPFNFVVNATNDEATDTDGKTSFREAILAANASAGADTVSFDPTVFPAASDTTIALTQGKMNVSDSVIIKGQSNAEITLDGLSANNIMVIASAGTLDVTISDINFINGFRTGLFLNFDGAAINAANTNLSLTRTNFKNNSTQLSGGAVFVTGAGSLVVNNCVFDSNKVDVGGLNNGGALMYNGSKSVTISDSTFKMNTADGSGGALGVIGASSVTITNSLFDQNQATGSSSTGIVGGGVILSGVSTVAITNSVFSKNEVTDTVNVNAAAALGLIGAATVTIDGCTFDQNKVANGPGGGLWTRSDATGEITIKNSTFSKNEVGNANGGGISINGNTKLTVVRSTLNENKAVNGGGIAIDGTTTPNTAGVFITTSTLSKNSAATDGGGLWVSGSKGAITIINSTVTLNETTAGLFAGGGLCFVNSTVGMTSITLNSSVVAQNVAVTAGQARDIATDGSVTTITANNTLVGVNDLGNFTLVGVGNNPTGVGTDAAPTDAKLKALNNYGGPTQTHLPDAASPLIGKGAANGETTDQRGVTLPQGVGVDIGSVERNLAAPTVLSVSINDGDARRSMVTKVVVTFDQIVSLDPGAITLERTALGLPPDTLPGNVLLNQVQSGNVVTLTFLKQAPSPGQIDIDLAGSLADGQYKLTVTASKVHGDSGDLAANSTTNFWRLFGDTTMVGDGTGLSPSDGNTLSDDFANLRRVFGSPATPGTLAAQLDSDGDGVVDADDFSNFRKRFGTTGYFI